MSTNGGAGNAEADSAGDKESTPVVLKPRREELAPLKFIGVLLCMIGLVGLVVLLMVLSKHLAFWPGGMIGAALLVQVPVGIGILLRREWARILFFWSVPLVFIATAPAFVCMSWVALFVSLAGYTLGGAYLLRPRVKTFFRKND